jgi:hypothetical protein
MVDSDTFVRHTARYYGHAEEDAFAARDLLNLRPEDLVVRFNGVAHFASTFGVNIRALAALIAESGTGIEPWEPGDRPSSEEWNRIREAEEQLGSPGDWAGTILALLDKVDRLRAGNGPRGEPEG